MMLQESSLDFARVNCHSQYRKTPAWLESSRFMLEASCSTVTPSKRSPYEKVCGSLKMPRILLLQQGDEVRPSRGRSVAKELQEYRASHFMRTKRSPPDKEEWQSPPAGNLRL